MLLAVGEAAGGELFLLMLAGGALGGSAAAFLGAPIWGLFYDEATRSHITGFHLAPIALAVVVVGAANGSRAGKRQHEAMHARDLAAWQAAG